MSPSIALARSRLIASPSPVPSFVRVVPVSIRKNGVHGQHGHEAAGSVEHMDHEPVGEAGHDELRDFGEHCVDVERGDQQCPRSGEQLLADVPLAQLARTIIPETSSPRSPRRYHQA